MATTIERVNPLSPDAITADSVKTGDRIVCWIPGDSTSVLRLVLASGPYMSDDDDLVVDVRHPDGHESVALTSELGLSGQRFTGVWSKVCAYDDTE